MAVHYPFTILASKVPMTKLASYELDVPSFFNPAKVQDWKRPVAYPERFNDAISAQKQFKVRSTALDKLRIALMPIDNQLTFCNPDFELFVAGQSGRGAIDDTARLCEFIYRNAAVLTEIAPTLDTHMAYQIFFATFLVDQNGNHPDPRYPTVVTSEDIRNGKWSLDPKVAGATGNPGAYGTLQRQLIYYVDQLSKSGQYALTIWPFHAMLGSLGHALVPALEEAVFYHSVLRGAQPKFQIKGENPLTENYSVFEPEVTTLFDGKTIAQKNTTFLNALLKNDIVIIAGQAKSHCVAWTIDHLLSTINVMDPSLVKKVYLLEDCTSSVVVPGVIDFTQQGDDAFRRFEAAGMHVVKSTDPIENWPGINVALLNA